MGREKEKDRGKDGVEGKRKSACCCVNGGEKPLTTMTREKGSTRRKTFH